MRLTTHDTLACLTLLAGLASLQSAPLPPSRPKYAPIEADGLRLGLRPAVEPVYRPSQPGKDWLDVVLTLTNRTDRARTSAPFEFNAASKTFSPGVSYVVWFPDGVAEHFTTSLSESEVARLAPATLPPGGTAQAHRYINNGLSRYRIKTQLQKHRWAFCLTAVSERHGLQSETVAYNGCPLPPPHYRPLDHTPDGPIARALRSEAARKWIELQKKYPGVQIDPATGEPVGGKGEHIPTDKKR